MIDDGSYAGVKVHSRRTRDLDLHGMKSQRYPRSGTICKILELIYIGYIILICETLNPLSQYLTNLQICEILFPRQIYTFLPSRTILIARGLRDARECWRIDI